MKCVCVLVHLCVCFDIKGIAGVKATSEPVDVEYGPSVIVCMYKERNRVEQ